MNEIRSSLSHTEMTLDHGVLSLLIYAIGSKVCVSVSSREGSVILQLASMVIEADMLTTTLLSSEWDVMVGQRRLLVMDQERGGTANVLRAAL
jgi:hypothetical protein